RGETVVRGAEEVRTKGGGRLAGMAAGLAAVGGAGRETSGGLVVKGKRLRGGRLDSHGDHRIAMSFAVASLLADGPIEILRTAEVATSFPGFVDCARAVGLSVAVAPAPAGRDA